MKKLIVAIMATTAILGARAEGYQVNSFSAKQEGMGHVGVAMKLGAESQIFNPAGVAFSNNTLEVSGAVSAIVSHAYAKVDGEQYETSSGVSTPFNVSAAFRVYDNLYAGLAFYTPYGSAIKWGQSWPGAVLNESVSLKVFTLQPTLSWRVTPKLSIGAGLMISWGSVDLDKGLLTWDMADKLADIAWSAQALEYQLANPGSAYPVQRPESGTGRQTPPASVNLQGKSEIALGFNVGAMYDITDQWTVGASFRSKMNMHVKAGDAAVTYDAPDFTKAVLQSSLDEMSTTNFDASMPCPYVLTFGLSYRPIKKLEIAADAQLTGWSAYKSLDITFAGLDKFDQHLPKNYRNSWTYHLGAQYGVTERLDIRAGLMVDCTPCREDNYNPETPGMTKIEPSVGLSFRPVKGLSIDLALMYVTGAGVKQGTGIIDQSSFKGAYDAGVARYNAAVAQVNALTGMSLPAYAGADVPATVPFKADYTLHALIPSVGISYAF